jgi:hypothetical protein
MVKKIVVAGSAAAVVLGAGTAALAAGSSSAAVSSPTSSAAPAPGTAAPGKAANGTAAPGKAANGKAAKARLAKGPLRRALHAQWVTRDGKSTTTFVTHDAIRGQVTAVSPTAITIKALDGLSQTYAVTSTTKVHTRADAKGQAGAIGEVHVGDKVAVTGTGTTSLIAQRVQDATK